MDVSIEVVDTKDRLGEFIKFPYDHYRLDKNFVPPLLGDQMKLLSEEKNFFWKNAKRQMFLAVTKKPFRKVVGRICAILDENYVKYYGEKTAYFGFYETENHPDISNALFSAARDWCKEQGAHRILGPLNPSINDIAGLLVDGFDTPPFVLMSYNPKYYVDFVEEFGFKKVIDLYAYFLDNSDMPEKLGRVVPKLMERSNFTIRKVDMKNLSSELSLFTGLYNKVLVENYAFVPISDEEMQAMAADLKVIADPDIIFIAESAGKPIGFSLSLPDINQVLIKMNGKLFPFGFITFLLNRKKINRIRVTVMGVLPEYRLRGVDLAFYYNTFKNGLAKGYIGGEMSWIREDNTMMRRVLENLGASISKTYRLYELPLGAE